MSDYRRIWTGNAVSNLADGITFIALPLLATSITHDPVLVSALSLAYALPQFLSVLGIGVVIDRVDRHRLLLLGSFSRGLLFAALTVVVVTGTTTMAALYAVYAVMGVIEILADSTAVAILPQAVPADRLDRANSQVAGTQVVVNEFIGPPLGAFLFGLAAFAPPMTIAAAFLAAGLAFWGLRGSYEPPQPDTQERVPWTRQIRDGLAWSWHQPMVRTIMLAGGLVSIGYMIPFSFLVLYARHVLGLDPAGYGLLLSVSALRGLAGSVVAAPLRRRLGYGGTMTVALAVGCLSWAAVALSGRLWVVTLALTVYVAHAVVWNVMVTSVRQRITPTAMMGRAVSVGRVVGIGGLALGAGLGGFLVKHLGYQAPFGVAAGFFAVSAVLVLTPWTHFRDLDGAAAENG